MTKLSPRITSFPMDMPREVRKAQTATRDQQIRELTRAELEEALASGELTQAEYNGEHNARTYYEGMNPAQLEFDATYNEWAKVEKRRRAGELLR